MISYKIKIGNGMIEFNGEDIKSAHKFGEIYGSLPKQCDICGGSDLFLSHKSPSGNDYYMIACPCGAELNFHQRKEGGGFYVKRDEKMSIYKPPVEQGKSEDKDIPF